MSRRRSLQGVFAVLSVAAMIACGSAGQSEPGPSETTGAGAGGGTSKGGAGGSGSTGKGGSGASPLGGGGKGTAGASGIFDGGAMDSGVTDASACAAVSTKGELTPLDMFIMLDQSGSMKEKVNGVSKWSAVTSGIKAFVTDKAADGIGVGIQFFGIPQGLGDSCNVQDYRSASVPIAPLPGNANAIVTELGKHSPSTSTPTAPALEGAILYAIDWSKAHPDHTTVVVFATDGDPTECDPQDVGSIAMFAATGFSWNPPVRTYVVGMAGATTSNLDAWAKAGGTKASYDASDPTKFVAALNAIRGSALTCELQIPKPTGSMMVDFNLVNVQVNENGKVTALGQVANQAACSPTAGGWYYDNPAMPQHIEICSQTCDTLKAVQMAPGASVEIDILLGCQTVIQGPN